MKTLQLILFVLAAVPGLANPSAPQSIFDQISHSEVVNVTIEVDMDALTGDIRSTEKHKSIFSFIDSNGKRQIWFTKIQLRGKFRRMKCTDIPPMKLFFGKKDLEKAGLAAFNDLKIVNHCIEDKEIAKELIIKEYLAYKMYNQLTDESFRVQLVHITYQDVQSGKKEKRWAFFIEDYAELRARLDMEKRDEEAPVMISDLEPEATKRVALFQYMIGNTDWDLRAEKNVKLLLQDEVLTPVPYDFDFSGLVNPPYGIANMNYGLTTLTERLFIGPSKDILSMQSEIELFQKNKKRLYDLVKNNRELSSSTRRTILQYMDSFFEELSVKQLLRSTPEARLVKNK